MQVAGHSSLQVLYLLLWQQHDAALQQLAVYHTAALQNKSGAKSDQLLLKS